MTASTLFYPPGGSWKLAPSSGGLFICVCVSHCNELIAMFSVPFDYNFYKNKMVVGIFEKIQGIKKKLYDLTCKGKGFTHFVRLMPTTQT